MDRMHYIDTRRKWMYGAYSAFMLSLIPAFYTDGQFKNKSQLYNKGQIDFSEANNYQIAMNVSKIISIACGVFWGYELVRYLMAANSVLPQKARKGNPSDFIMDYSKVTENDVPQDNSNNDSTEGTSSDMIKVPHARASKSLFDGKSNSFMSLKYITTIFRFYQY